MSVKGLLNSLLTFSFERKCKKHFRFLLNEYDFIAESVDCNINMVKFTNSFMHIMISETPGHLNVTVGAKDRGDIDLEKIIAMRAPEKTLNDSSSFFGQKDLSTNKKITHYSRFIKENLSEVLQGDLNISHFLPSIH